MIDDIIGEFLGAALAPSGKFGERLAALLCLASGIFSIGFGIWFAFVALEEASFTVKVGILLFFALIAFPCFFLFRRFCFRARVPTGKYRAH